MYACGNNDATHGFTFEERANVRGDFGAYPVVILMFPSPTGYMLHLSVFLHSINSSFMISKFREVLNFNQLFLKLYQFIWN